MRQTLIWNLEGVKKRPISFSLKKKMLKRSRSAERRAKTNTVNITKSLFWFSLHYLQPFCLPRWEFCSKINIDSYLHNRSAIVITLTVHKCKWLTEKPNPNHTTLTKKTLSKPKNPWTETIPKIPNNSPQNKQTNHIQTPRNFNCLIRMTSVLLV